MNSVEEAPISQAEETTGGMLPYVIFSLKGQKLGLSAAHVQEMFLMPEVTPVPNTPDYLRGVINLRGKILKLVDLRRFMQMASMQEETDELIEMLNVREQDHKDWLAELERAVKSDGQFSLATDPHQCAFGKWYDSFKPTSAIVSMELKKLLKPHREIHETAKLALDLRMQGNNDEAFELIQKRKSDQLAAMIHHFKNIKQTLKETQREMVLVFAHTEETIAITVDDVISVEKMPIDSMMKTEECLTQESIQLKGQIGRRERTNEIVLLIEPTALEFDF